MTPNTPPHSTHPTLTLIFESPNGFVTDFGAPLELRDAETGVVIIPRYGVWKHDGRKYNVVLTTDDVEAARARAEEPHA